jgi:hypothetical protein
MGGHELGGSEPAGHMDVVTAGMHGLELKFQNRFLGQSSWQTVGRFFLQ